MDGAPFGGRGEGQADGLAAWSQAVVLLGDQSAAKTTRMGDATLLDSDNSDNIEIREDEL